MNKPEFLYHGGKELVKIIKPHKASGICKKNDQLNAVYATPKRDLAVLFALSLIPDNKGQISWSTEDSSDNRYLMKISYGKLNLKREGYLYKVPLNNFEKIDELQWISYKDIEPLDYEIIDPNDFKELIIKSEKENEY